MNQAPPRGKMPRWVLLLALTAIFALLLCVPAAAAVNPPTPPTVPEATVPDNPAGTGSAIEPILPDSPLLQEGGGPGSADSNVSFSINGSSSDAVNVMLLLTVLTVLPSILLMMTCFTRIVIVFSLLRNALGLQQTPPNQVLIGLALFLSLFIMFPVVEEINETAYQPFRDGDISGVEFIDRAKVPLRDFMLKNTKQEDLNLFLNLSETPAPQTVEEYSMSVVVPAFITSEVKRAFLAGFLLYIPFLILDMVVGSALMSMGMMMLPPVTVSLPFKLLLFVLVDGWGLLIQALAATYR